MSHIDLSISIVSFNTRELLRDCLSSVFKETAGIPFEVFVVDNNSRDGSAEMVTSEFPQVALIRNRKNRGFAAANNQVLTRAQGRYFLMLNPDTVIVERALEKLVHFMDKKEECGICCPQLIYPDGRLQVSYMSFRTARERANWVVKPRRRDFKSIVANVRKKNRDKQVKKKRNELQPLAGPVEIERPRGACFLVRRKAVEQVGPLDDRFFMYCEEVDWALRIRQAGWKNFCVPEARVIHVWGGSTYACRQVMEDIQLQSDYKYYYKHFGFAGFFRLWSAHALGAVMALLLGLYASLFGWLGWNDFKAGEQFNIFRTLSRKLFLFKKIHVE